jgi:hypothetical protein
MEVNSLVVCIKGFPGILEEDSIYTVTQVKSTGNILVAETMPPSPHTSFDKRRFKEVQGPMDVQTLVNEIIFLEI